MASERKIPLKNVPGLYLLKQRYSQNKYFYLYHEASGKIFAKWTSKPVTLKDKEFITQIETILNQHKYIDWTWQESEFPKDWYPRLQWLASKLRNICVDTNLKT